MFLIFAAKIIWLLVWLGVLGFGIYWLVQKQFLRGTWLVISSFFGILSVFVGFFPNKPLVGVFFSAIALCIIALGENLLSNLYYAVTAPTYSLRMMARNDTFSFSLLLTFLGGLFLGLYASILQPTIVNSFNTFAQSFVSSALAGYQNPIYKTTIEDFGVGRLSVLFDIYYVSNFVWLPVIWVGLWFFFGLLYWFLGRLFGSPAAYKEILAGFSYWFSLVGILTGYFLFRFLISSLSAPPGSLSLGFTEIIGAILILASLVYFIICISQSEEIGIVQSLVIFVLISAVFVGIAVALYTYQAKPAIDAFKNELLSADPSKM